MRMFERVNIQSCIPARGGFPLVFGVSQGCGRDAATLTPCAEAQQVSDRCIQVWPPRILGAGY